jgi:hypothetical protein
MLVPGGRVHLAPVAAADPAVPRHDPAALADALGVVLAELDGTGIDGTGPQTHIGSDAHAGSVPQGPAPGGQETRRSNPWR